MQLLSTGQVADLLGVYSHRVEYLTRDRKVRPAKGPTGAFYWTWEEVRLAAKFLGLAEPDLPVNLSVTCTGGVS